MQQHPAKSLSRSKQNVLWWPGEGGVSSELRDAVLEKGSATVELEGEECVCVCVQFCPLTIMSGLDTPKYQLEARRERLNIQRTPDPSPALGFQG